MAKSTRSKVKRHFRAKKRQEGVYAATEAARLNRLHQKLKVLTTKDADGDVDIPEEEVDTFSDEQVEGGEQLPGWCWFASFGLFDPRDVTAESMASMERLYTKNASAVASGTSALRRKGRDRGRLQCRNSDRTNDHASFDHLFLGLPLEVGSGPR